jgi:hypothetical protein
MGRNVRPTRVLEPQFVAVARAEPRARIERGKSLRWELEVYPFGWIGPHAARGDGMG